MIKKTLTYTDFNGQSRTEDFYFNLTRGELVELELTQAGGKSFSDYLLEISESKDNKKIIETFKEILHLSYGVKSPDGRRFVKSDDVWNDFIQSEAYSEFILELLGDADSASKFVAGLISNLPAGKSVSDIARERSEAQLQGHKQVQTTTVQTVPDLPPDTPLATSALAQPNVSDVQLVPDPENTQAVVAVHPQKVLSQNDLNTMSVEELRAALAAQSRGSGYVDTAIPDSH